jgi:hypothetical protein
MGDLNGSSINGGCGCKQPSFNHPPAPVSKPPVRNAKDTTMTSTNVIEFAPILQRRREQQLDRATYVSRSIPWRNRYRDGIDGLSRRAWNSPGEVVPFVATGSRPHATVD